MAPPLNVLLLCDDYPGHANTVLEQIDALQRLSRHRVRTYNPRGVERSRFLDLAAFDAVVVHWTLFAISDHYLAPAFREQLARYDGLKVQMVQDDYRAVDEMSRTTAAMGIDVLFTLVPPRNMHRVWRPDWLPGVELVPMLAGYVDERTVRYPAPPLEERPLHVAYRGRTLPYWLGRLAQEKAWIAQEFAARADAYGLRYDVGWRESDRIYGQSWLAFMSSARATLGVESGASITDFDGSAEAKVKAYLSEHPNASFDEVHAAVLEPYEGNVMVNAISPRIFEAIALRTALVLFPGEYSGVIEPERHYIPLEKDFSNFAEVAARLHDLDDLGALTERAYRDVIASGRWSLDTFVRQFDDVLERRATAARRPPAVGYRLAQVEARLPGGGVTRRAKDRVRGRLWAVRQRPVEPGDRRGQVVRAAARLALDPTVYLVKAGLALRLLGRRRLYRRVLWRYLRDVELRGRVGLDVVLEDLLKLDLARRQPLRIERGDGVVTLVTSADDADRRDGAALDGPLEELRWDHSARGTWLLEPVALGKRMTIHVGDGGRYRFAALPAVLDRHPELVAPTLSALRDGR